MVMQMNEELKSQKRHVRHPDRGGQLQEATTTLRAGGTKAEGEGSGTQVLLAPEKAETTEGPSSRTWSPEVRQWPLDTKPEAESQGRNTKASPFLCLQPSPSNSTQELNQLRWEPGKHSPPGILSPR